MKYILSFILGTTFGALGGAIVALLFAPSSGEDLRSNIKTRADSEYASLQDQWQRGIQDLQTRMDKMSSDLQKLKSGSKEIITPASED
jgi:gas vesicle protein